MHASNDSISPAERQRIAATAHVVAEGGIVVYPTETLYGLGVDAGDPPALQRLVTLKGREPGKPIAVLISDVTMLGDLVEDIPPAAGVLMRRFWPGPLTLVLQARELVSPLLTGDSGSIGVRLSSHPLATALVRAVARPLTAPSANPAGLPPPRRVEEARAYFGEQVDAYLDGGYLPGEPASTVVDMRSAVRVLRAGAVPIAAIEAALQGGV